MKKLFVATWLLLIANALSYGQAKTRRLPSIINHPSLNLFAPYVSLDGDALLFVSDDGEDHSLTVSYTSRENDWRTPVVLPKHINHRLVYQNGFALSADGKTMYFTSSKSPTVGGYDIMMSELKGTSWAEPQNLMLPINTKSNEGCPSFSADGNTVYFMRCDNMNQNSASGCKIFSTKKKPNGQWEEPTALPPHLNTGNSQTPRIMADNETLIFSSDQMPSRKGGMDLYLSRLRDGQWTEPQPLDYVNTEKDDQFVSVTALGRYLLKDTPGSRRTNELVEFLIPAELRPKGMMKVEGKITNGNSGPVSAYISVVDLADQKRVYSGRPNADGTYMLYLMEGSVYEMSFDPEQSDWTYFAKRYDLTTDRTPQRDRVQATLKKLEPGDELLLEGISFKPHSAVLEASAEGELKRLARLAKASPGLRMEIQVMLTGYVQDSVPSDPDLTEMMMDSVTTQFEDIDTLGQLYLHDTVLVHTLYHNDRTHVQAESIIQYLVEQGADRNNFMPFGNAIPATLPEDKKTIIKAVARKP